MKNKDTNKLALVLLLIVLVGLTRAQNNALYTKIAAIILVILIFFVVIRIFMLKRK